jgi:hypothetical protein
MSSQQILDISFVKPFLADNGFEMFKGLASKTPLLIASDIQSRFVRLQLSGLTILNLDKVLIESADGKNLLEGADVLVSSSFENQARFDGKRLISGKPTGGVNYHSERELNPWVVIDLKETKSIARIEVYNRNDRFFNRSLTMAVYHSNDLKSWSTLHDNLAYKVSDAYLALNEQQQALVDCASMNITSINKLIAASEKEGDKNTALALFNSGNKLLFEHNLALGPHGLTQTFDVKSDKQKDLSYQRLSTFLSQLINEFGVDAFVSSGTLLGFVRQGEFLGHDDDLDICYISKESTPDGIVRERNEIKAFLNGKGYRVTDSDVAHLWVHSGDNIMFDLFTGWIENNKCMMNPLPLPGVAASDVLPLKTLESHGYPIMMPANPEALMELNYGKSWKVPDPLWKFDWSHARKLYDFLYFGK